MTQPTEELRWRIEQLENEREYIERIAGFEPENRGLQKLFSELDFKLAVLISDLYASGNPQSKTAKTYPKR